MSVCSKSVCLVLAILTSSVSAAELPKVEAVFPGVGQRGTTFTCRFVGSGLEEIAEVLFYSRSLHMVAVRSANSAECEIDFHAGADVDLGSHALRLRTAQGISDLVRLRITPLRVVTELEPNNSPDEAYPVALNSTVVGVIDAGDVDSFAVELRQGERLSVDVEGVRLGGELLDTTLKIYGPDGGVIAEVDDTALRHQDPLVSLVAAQSGRYVVQLHECSFLGSERSRYALHLGSFPLPTMAFPMGGSAGEAISVQLFDELGDRFEQTVNLPLVAESIDYPLFAERDGCIAPTALPFRVSPHPNFIEQEPNNSVLDDSLPLVTLPAALNGILERPGDVDCYRVRLPEGVTYHFQVFAARIGSPADTVLQLYDGLGRLLLTADDVDSHDSQFTYTAWEDATYVLRIFDKRGKGGTNFVYRIEAQPDHPRLTAFLPRPERLNQEQQTICVPRGNRVLARLGCLREGVDGDVRLVPSEMPEGVTLSDILIPGDQYWVPVVVAASESANVSGSLAEIRAYGGSESPPVSGTFRQTIDLVTGRGETVYETTSVDRLAMAVVEPAQFQLSLQQPRAGLPQSGTLGLRISVQREPEFNGSVEVSFPFLPPWVEGPASITIPASEKDLFYPLRAHAQAEVRSWPLVAVASPGRESSRVDESGTSPGVPSYRSGRSGRSRSSVAVCSELVTLDVIEPPVTGTLLRTNCELGHPATVECRFEIRGAIPTSLTATLRGLPNRVSSQPVPVPPGVQSVAFTVAIPEDAPLGRFPDLYCELAGLVEGDPVTYMVAPHSTLEIRPAGHLVFGADGRPLSRLELLRLSAAAPESNRLNAHSAADATPTTPPE